MRFVSFVLVAFAASLCFTACGGGDHAGHGAHSTPKTSLDSLYSSIWDSHDAVMPKMGKIRGAQRRAGQLLDSINLALNKRSSMETAQEKSWKVALQSLLDKLNYADYAMDRWMTEFDIDSAQQKGDARRPYLESEKVKVDKIKEAILRSLSTADSLFAAIR